ncbi:glycerate kinase [Propionibacteriaceae bacterium Y1685]|uniref:glycerate kinase n=1 Tax=Microlunatus sp. Y1700 TaxID=3418487 RepID=UPI003B78EDEC
METVVLCPDSFKGTVEATAAAQAIAEGWRRVRPEDHLLVLGQADGGEGTAAAIAAARAGQWHEVAGVIGPDGRPVTGHWYELGDGTAVCDLADSSGLPLMAEADPLGATTYGLGQVIADAVAHGVSHLWVGLGGSASTDGGAGALQGLGFHLLDAAGKELPYGGAALADLDRIVAPQKAWPPITVLTDVTAPLLGAAGAAHVFGPQKGADAADVETLDAALDRFARVLDGPSDHPGMGAAGGVGYGFARALGATIEPGAALIADLTGLTAAATTADVLITGEGCFDATSLTGKVTGHALDLAEPQRTRRCVVAGRVQLQVPDVETVSLTDLAGSAAAALADPLTHLRSAGERLAHGQTAHR